MFQTARMKALRIVLLYLLFSELAAANQIDCEIIPFKGRTDTYREVREQDSYKPYHERKEWSVLQCPKGGYIGEIVINDKAAVGATACLTVRNVTTDDLLDPVKHAPDPVWFEDMGLHDPEAYRRRLLYE